MGVLEVGDHVRRSPLEAHRAYHGARLPVMVALRAGEVAEGGAAGGTGPALADPREGIPALLADEVARHVAAHASGGPDQLGRAERETTDEPCTSNAHTTPIGCADGGHPQKRVAHARLDGSRVRPSWPHTPNSWRAFVQRASRVSR